MLAYLQSYYHHLRSTVNVHFSNETVDWTNENVSFGARNYECLSKKSSTFCSGLTILKTFFRVLQPWCHCDFRNLEKLKVNKFGQIYRTGTPAVQALVVELLFVHFDVNVQLVKGDIVTAVIYCHSNRVSLRET